MASFFRNSKVFNETCLVSLTILTVTIGYPIFFPLIVVIIAYRSIVEKIIQQTDKRFGKMLKGLDAVLSAGSPYTNPEPVLQPILYLDGVVDKTHLINSFKDRIIEHHNEEGHSVYPQLRQRIVRKLGYNFWFNVTNFKLEDHIKFLNESNPHELIKHSEMKELICELNLHPFDSERSPWEILLIPRLQSDEDPKIKSVLIFRVHHCLADGFSIVNMLLRFSNKIIPSPLKNYQAVSGLNFHEKVVLALRIFVESPYHVLKTMYFSNDNNEWLQKVVNKRKGKFAGQQTAFISLQTLKDIKSVWNMSLASVMTAIIMQATARAMKKRNVTGNISKLHVVCPVPLPNHPESLCNHWTFCKIPVNVDIMDVEKTARNICTEFEKLKHSVTPLSFSLLTNLVGILPTSLIPAQGSFLSSTVIFSNVPGPNTYFEFGGCKVLEVFVGGSSPRGFAVGSFALSCNGRVRYIIGGDQTNISAVEARILAVECEKVVKEMVELSKKSM